VAGERVVLGCMYVERMKRCFVKTETWRRRAALFIPIDLDTLNNFKDIVIGNKAFIKTIHNL
jgi:hypothetical protein